MTAHVKIGGVISSPVIYAKLGGTIYPVQSGWAKIGGVISQFYSGDVITFVDHNIEDFNTGSAASTFRVRSDGTHEGVTVVSGLDAYGNWVTPTSSAGNYEIRATLTGDALDGSSSATATWLALSTNRAWTLAATSGLKSSSLVVEIRRASDSVVVDTINVSLDVDAS